MFIFRLLNIMVGQKISYNDKARSSARKGLGAKSACIIKDCSLFQRSYGYYRELQSTESFPKP